MPPNRGDIYQCSLCQLRMIVLSGPQFQPLLPAIRMVCTCGEEIMLRASDESAAEPLSTETIEALPR